MTSPLHVRPKPGATTGCVLDVTPESAGWTYVGFRLHRLSAGDVLADRFAGRECCIVLLGGTVSVDAGGQGWARVGGRANPFAGAPHSVYVPADLPIRIAALDDAEFALCTAPGTGGGQARLIPPQSIGVEERGTGSNARTVRNILPETEPADSLLIAEVITPGGNWSSYPPHKHDALRPPGETALEEVYYHRTRPEGGFAFQRVYTDDRALDETIAADDGDVVLVPRGYHPVAAAHGYDLYYLNVMAGPQRLWRIHNDPAHAWIVEGGRR